MLAVLSDAVSAWFVAELGGEVLHVLRRAANLVARERAVARTARAARSADRRGAAGARRRSAARPARDYGSPPALSTSVRSPRRAKLADGRWRASPLTRPPGWFEAALERLTATHPADRPGRCEPPWETHSGRRATARTGARCSRPAALAGALEDADSAGARRARQYARLRRARSGTWMRIASPRSRRRSPCSAKATTDAECACWRSCSSSRRSSRSLAERRRLSDEAKCLASGDGDPTTLGPCPGRHAVLWIPPSCSTSTA